MIYTKKSFYIYIYSVIIFVCCFICSTLTAIHGRYTKNIEDYELSIPHRVTEFGEFITYEIPQYFRYNSHERYKREASSSEKIHYNIILGGKDLHLEVWPNHGFISPTLVSEVYDPNVPVYKRNLKRVNHKLCHFTGKVRGVEGSSVAVSVCDGLAGYFLTDSGHYFIEPIAEHEPNENGLHVHIVYKRKLQHGLGSKKSPWRMDNIRCITPKNWEEAWFQRLRDSRTVSVDKPRVTKHYVEVLIVADKKFIDYNKNNDLEEYIMTIINMVFGYFKDESIGSDIDIQVVRIIYLNKIDEHLDLSINSNAEETIESFCKWTTQLNPKDVKNPQHHDVAILLTRYDLCSENKTECNIMGLAYVAGTCQPNKACTINEDNGLALGITITHELGHSLGCGHDGADSPCDFEMNGEYFLMSPCLHMSTIRWSSCSKKFMNEFFENGLGACLEDEPDVSLFTLDTAMLPGAVYDADYQCDNQFPGMVHCVLEESKICEMLYCKVPDGENCVSRGERPADGTKCSNNMWCFRGQCIQSGTEVDAVNGGWGIWGEWSKCSRTCGGGITFSERNCDNPHPQNHGLNCVGNSRRIKMCNINDCPLGPTFRDIQCMAFNDVPFKSKLHAWKPYHVKGHECDLICINENNVYVTLASRVKDGTPCRRGLRDRCIFGKCRTVGCDWVIDSPAIEDVCGICNGDGTHCKLVEKEYDYNISANGLEKGYHKIDTIPAGVHNIKVYEKVASQNTIAVSAEDGKMFYLNGDFVEDSNGDKYFGTVVGFYDHPTIDKETLHIPGPTKEPLILYEVFYTSENPGIKYSYAVPSTKHLLPSYSWKFTEFGVCSTICDWGYRISKPICVEKTRGPVSPGYCSLKKKPEVKVMECFLRKCETKWHPGKWNICTGCKDKPGTKNRTVECIQEAPTLAEDPVIVDDFLCTGVKPKTTQICCSQIPCNKKTASGHASEVEQNIAKLGPQIQKIEQKFSNSKQDNRVYTKEKKKYEIFKPERFEIISDLRNEKEIKRYLKPDKYTIPYKKMLESKLKRSDSDNTYIPCKTTPSSSDIREKSGFILDHVPPQGLQLVEVPIVEDSEVVKLSDVGIQRSGDKVSDTLNFCQAKIFKGKEADAELKRLKNSCKTPETL